MSRQSIVGQIYGYGVSLIAVLIILVTIHGIVNNIFRVIHPTAGGGIRVLAMQRFGGPGMWGAGMRGPGMGMPGGGPMMWGFERHRMFGAAKPSAGASAAPTSSDAASATQPSPDMGGPMMAPGMHMRGNAQGDARFNAFRLLVVDIVMLIVGILLFRWHWDWLHKAA